MGTWEIILTVFLFLVGLVCLIKGGDWFVDGATGIAKRMRIPEIIIGATIVSIGTTLPEVMVSSDAALSGHPEIAYGNALGSIICNTALIAALTVAIRPSKVDRKSFLMPVLFFFTAMAFYAGVSYGIGRFDRWAGVTLIGLFLIYMSTVLWTERKRSKNGVSESHAEEEKPAKPRPLWLEIGMLVVGAALIAVGARLLVDKGTVIAKLLGVPESVIALTFVALGTSLPELVTAITSLAKGHSALSLGNIVGANLFNLVLVSGISTTLRPYDIPAGKLVFGHSSSLVMDIPLCFILMALLTVPALISKKVMRWQGILLLAVYAAYVTFQFFI